jgi:hypothetical protein
LLDSLHGEVISVVQRRRRLVSAWIGTAYAQEDAAAAHAQWRTAADQLRPKVPKLAALMDAVDEDVWPTWTSPPRTARSCTARMRSTRLSCLRWSILLWHG